MAKSKQDRETQTVARADVGTVDARALVPAPPVTFDVTQPSEAAAAFLNEVEGPREQPTSIGLVKIDHKEGVFVTPGGELKEIISGYPIFYFQTRRYYEAVWRPGVKGSPPDCWSADLIRPHESSLSKQSPACAGCAHNQFGSARDGRSKACGEYTWIFLLNPEFGNPPINVLIAPPSSIRTLLGTRFTPGYFSMCAARHRVYELVWSHFRLQRENEDAVHVVLQPTMGEVASDVTNVRKIAGLRNQFLKAMMDYRMQTPDLDRAVDSTATVNEGE